METVFGLPGTQNVALFEALRKSRLRTIVATHELAASFMANGYARASGRPGVLLTIPGPGFTYSLTGLAEALLDSAPVLHIVGGPADGPGRRFQLQALDQRAVVAPLVKRVFDLRTAEGVEATLEEAYAVSRAGEPGPVVVQVSPGTLSDEGTVSPPAPSERPHQEAPSVDEIALRVCGARRIVLYVGQGANGAAAELLQLMETLKAPLVTTTSGRGVVPEDNPWVLCFDRGSVPLLNELLDSANLVLALGCKFSHNGAHGFRLRLAPDRLIHVDASEAVLGANYDASLTLAADVPSVIRALLEPPFVFRDVHRFGLHGGGGRPVETARHGGGATWYGADDSRRAAGVDRGLLRRPAPCDARGILPGSRLRPAPDVGPTPLSRPPAPGSHPSDESSGNGLRACRRPSERGSPAQTRTVVALLGDGGFAMSGLELLTAVRERDTAHRDRLQRRALQRHQWATARHVRAPSRDGTPESGLPPFRGVGRGPLCEAGRGRRRDALQVIRAGGVCLVEVVLHESVSLRARLRTVRDSLASRAGTTAR